MSNNYLRKFDLLPSDQRFPFNIKDFCTGDIQNSKWLATFFDNIPTAIIFVRDDGTLSFMNQRALKLFGINHEALEIDNCLTNFSALYPDANSNVEDMPLIQSLKKGKVVHNKEMVIKDVKGKHINVSVTTAPVYDEKGKIYAAFISFENISERITAQEKVQGKSLLLKGINQIFQEVIDYKSKEDLGKRCLQVAMELTKSGIGFIGENSFRSDGDNKSGWFSCQLADGKTNDFSADYLQMHIDYFSQFQSGKTFYINVIPSPKIRKFNGYHPQLHNLLSIPLIDRGTIIGMIGLANKEGGYSEQDVEVMDSLAPAIVQALNYKQAEISLHESEEKYRNIVNTASEGIWYIDADYKIKLINQTMANWLGYQPQELIGRSVMEFVAEEDMAAGKEHCAKIAAGIPDRIDFKLMRKDGTHLWVLVSSSPRSDEQGDYLGSLTMFTDITERKEFENKLTFQANLLESVHDAILATDKDFVVTYWNAMAEKMFGWTDKEALGQTISKLFKNPQLPRKDFLRELKKTGYTSIERVLKHKDGRKIHVSIHSRIVWDEKGNFKGMVASLWDITERIKTEEILSKSEQRHAFMLNLSDILRPLADPNLIQEAATRILGEYLGADRVLYLKTDMENNTCEVKHDYFTDGLQSHVGVYGIEPFKASFDYALSGQTMIANDLYMLSFLSEEERGEYKKLGIRAVVEVPLIKEGKLLSLLSIQSAIPRRWTEEEIALIEETAERTWAAVECAYAQEALRESEASALTLVKKLCQADKNKDDFISMLSHELRNPMASIVMSLSLLDRMQTGGEKASQVTEIMKHQVYQLSHLVNDLLEVTRINNHKIKLTKESVELNHLLHRVVEDYRTQFDDKGVDLEAEYALSTLLLEADPARLIQVIGNLLHNAVKFTEKGDRTFVSLRKDKETGEAVIMVRDTGIGIKAEMLPNLFLPFMQADNSLERSRGGLGLGLCLVKGMVELHGGSVSAKSEGLGKGAEFTIRLPLPDKKRIIDNIDQKPEEGPSLRILMIEDNANLNKIMCDLLRLLGHETQSAFDGAGGLAKAKEFKPDVILCDIGLPGINGYEVAQHIRQDNDLKDAFLIALSGYAEAEDIEKSKMAGFDKHLAKPVELETLELILSEVY